MTPAAGAALLAGGASGLGAATARRLAAAGLFCILFDRDEARGSALADELAGCATFVAGDIANTADVEAALDAAGQRPLRLAVITAFKGGGAPLLATDGAPLPLERFRQSMEVNLVGTFNVMRLAAARMAKNEPEAHGQRGVIVNTSSIAAFDGQVTQLSYAAAKAAIAGMTLPAARDLAPFGIRVMTIAPGTFMTPAVAALSDAYKEALAGAALFPQQLGDPDYFARLVVSILDNPFLNAEVIRLDAGARLSAPGWRFAGR